jgi:hypothetical protein
MRRRIAARTQKSERVSLGQKGMKSQVKSHKSKAKSQKDFTELNLSLLIARMAKRVYNSNSIMLIIILAIADFGMLERAF